MAHFPSSKASDSSTAVPIITSKSTVWQPVEIKVRSEGMGLPFLLVLIYLIMEYARPANPMKIPMVISIIFFLYWFSLPAKNWSTQIICFFLLVGTIMIMGPFAVNSYSIWWSFRNMMVQLIFVCIPIIHILNSVLKISYYIYVLIGVYGYAALYGILHGGIGPGGHIGDENDLALAINMIIPFVFVSIILVKNLIRKAIFTGIFSLMIVAEITTNSRGGFLGFLSVMSYCFILSPQKKVSIVIAIFAILGLWAYAPDGYWTEMAGIIDEAKNTDPALGTGALRKEYWAVAQRMFYDNPFLGVGLGNFPWNADHYQTEEQKARIGRSYGGTVVHSLYFSILAELGIVGSSLFIAIIWCNLKDTKYIKNAGEKAKKIEEFRKNSMLINDLDKTIYYSHAIRASLLGYLTAGTFLSVFTYPHFWLLTALTVALKKAATELLNGNDENL